MALDRRVQVTGGGSISSSDPAAAVRNRLSSVDIAGPAISGAAKYALESGAAEGRLAGMKTDESGAAIPPELKAGFGFASQAFNEAAKDSYLASVTADARNNLARIANENPDNYDAYNAAVDGYLEGIQEQLLPEVAEEVVYGIEKTRQRDGTQVSLNHDIRVRNDAISAHDASIDAAMAEAERALVNGDEARAIEANDAAIAEIDKKEAHGYLLPEEAAEEKRVAAKFLVQTGQKQYIRNVYDQEGQTAAFQAIEAMQSEVPEGWTVKEWDQFTTDLYADISQRVTMQAKIRSKEEIAKGDHLSRLLIAIGSGGPGSADALSEYERLYNDPESGITTSQLTSARKSFLDSQTKARQKALDYSAVAERVAGADQVIIDKKTASNFYTEEYLANPDNQNNAKKAHFVDRVKFVPDEMRDELKQYISSGNPDLIMQAADLVDRIDNTMGIADDVFSKEERAFARQVQLLSANMDPEKAIRMAQQITDPANEAQRNARESDIKKGKWNARNTDDVVVAFQTKWNGWNIFNGGTDVPGVLIDRLSSEYGALRDAYYIAGYGDRQDSSAMALKDISRNWGEWEFGGQTLFSKYPMSAFYPSIEGTDYITEQAMNDASALMGENVDSSQIMFVDDDRTAREATNGEPSYLMYIANEYGEFVPTGQRFKPDPQFVNAQAAEREAEIRAENQGRFEKQRDWAKVQSKSKSSIREGF